MWLSVSLVVERFVPTTLIHVRNKDKPCLMMTTGVRFTSSTRLIFGRLIIALELTMMSLSTTNGLLMKFMPRLAISLVSSAGMFWWTPSVPISGGKPWSLLCLALVWICLFLLSFVGWWSGMWVGREGSNAVGQFWQKAAQGPCKSAIHLPSVSQSHYLCLQVTGGEAALVASGFIWWHWPIGYAFFKRTADVLAPRIAVVYRRLICLGSFPVCWRVAMSPQFQRVHLTAQWPITDKFP